MLVTSIFSFSQNIFYHPHYQISIFSHIYVMVCKSFKSRLFLTLSQTSTFRLIQIEDFANNNFKSDENGRRFSKWVENTAGKGEIVVTHNLSFPPSVFERHVLHTCKKQRLVWERVKFCHLVMN